MMFGRGLKVRGVRVFGLWAVLAVALFGINGHTLRGRFAARVAGFVR